MTTEELFYLFGIIFMASWLIFLIVILVVGYILLKRFREAKTTLKDSALAAVGMRLLSPSPFKGLVTLLPLAQFFFSRFQKRK